MRGVILGNGIISGEDGKRYRFNLQDIQNLNGKSEQSLEKCEVDFEVDESGETALAKEVFIIKSPTNFAGSFTNSLNDNSIASIKLKAYIGIVSSALIFLPFVGWLFGIIGIVAFIFALIGISKESGCKSLIFNYIIASVLSFFATIIISFSAVTAFFGAASGANSSVFAGISFVAILGFVIALGALFFAYKYLSLLAKVTNEKLFLYTFFVDVAATLTMLVPFLGVLLGIASYIIEIIAWIKFKEIRKMS